MEFAAILVELAHQQPLAELHIAPVRLKPAGEQLEQGGLARAVGSDNGDAVAPMDAQGEISHDLMFAICEGHTLCVDHLGARTSAFRCLHLHRAEPADLFPTLGAKPAQTLKAA